MRLMITVALILSCSGCKHFQKRETPFPALVAPKVGSVEVKVEEPKQPKVINISLLPIQNLTIKAF